MSSFTGVIDNLFPLLVIMRSSSSNINLSSNKLRIFCDLDKNLTLTQSHLVADSLDFGS